MVTYYVEKDEIYKVSATVNCAVYDASGSTIATCDAGSIVTFKAPTDKILISDNNAALNCISETPGDLSGLTEHVNNSSIHVTATDKANWNRVVDTSPDWNNHVNNSTLHVTADQKAALDDPTLNERVLNIPELYPGAGSGENYDMFTLTQALNRANQYITQHGLTEKITGGLKVKFKNLEGYYVQYMWDGVGELTDQTAWTSTLTSNAFNTHAQDTTIHITEAERGTWNETSELADIVWDINKMFPGQGNGGSEVWNQFYAIRQLRKYFYDIDVTNGDSNFTYSKQMMVSGIKLRHYRAASSGYIPDPIWATYTWKGGTIDWTWNPDVDGETNKFDDFSNTTKWEFEVTEHMWDAHLEGETTDENGTELLHITSEERTTWNNAAPKNLGTANAVVITDADGNITASTIISVSELNTLNNNLTNLATKLADLESRLAALETA